MKPALEPWQIIKWRPEQEQLIYRNWGVFYKHKQQLNIAANYYDKALEINGQDPKSLVYRSMCKRNIAQTQGALSDVTKAIKLDGKSAITHKEHADVLYELNQFEDCKVKLHRCIRKFQGKRTKPFRNQLQVINENFNDSLGPSLGPFLMRNHLNIKKLAEELRKEQEMKVDPRPQWRRLRDEGKCDVVSIPEEEHVFLSPREIARRERGFKAFNQIYFNKSWKDILFLRNLQDHPDLILPQGKYSTSKLRNLACTQYNIVRQFSKMLQARSPIYNNKYHKCQQMKICDRLRESHLYRIQYQTRRNMFAVLKRIKELRERADVWGLTRYIEDVMGDYTVLKTHRVMPWKLEFMHEVYNTLALTHVDRMTVPPNINSFVADRMHIMLRLPRDKNKDHKTQFVFGDRSTYGGPSDAIDPRLLTIRKLLQRLELRLRFSKLPLERTYLMFEISRCHLRQSHFDDCCSAAKKAVEEAISCKSYIWQFLSLMQICKSHTMLRKVERARDVLQKARVAIQPLRCPELMAFIETCININEDDIVFKKRHQSVESIRKRQSSKFGSQTSSDNSDENVARADSKRE